jgi:hypothetical protein
LNLQTIELRATLALGNLQFLGLQICQIFGSFESPGLEGHAHRYPLLNKPKYNNHVPFFDMNRWIPWNSNSVRIRATDYAFVSWLQCPCPYWVALLTFVAFGDENLQLTHGVVVVRVQWRSNRCRNPGICQKLNFKQVLNSYVNGNYCMIVIVIFVSWFFVLFDRSQGDQQRRNQDGCTGRKMQVAGQ